MTSQNTTYPGSMGNSTVHWITKTTSLTTPILIATNKMNFYSFF